jgi:hypothetical protein
MSLGHSMLLHHSYIWVGNMALYDNALSRLTIAFPSFVERVQQG